MTTGDQGNSANQETVHERIKNLLAPFWLLSKMVSENSNDIKLIGKIAKHCETNKDDLMKCLKELSGDE